MFILSVTDTYLFQSLSSPPVCPCFLVASFSVTVLSCTAVLILTVHVALPCESQGVSGPCRLLFDACDVLWESRLVSSLLIICLRYHGYFLQVISGKHNRCQDAASLVDRCNVIRVTSIYGCEGVQPSAMNSEYSVATGESIDHLSIAYHHIHHGAFLMHCLES